MSMRRLKGASREEPTSTTSVLMLRCREQQEKMDRLYLGLLPGSLQDHKTVDFERSSQPVSGSEA